MTCFGLPAAAATTSWLFAYQGCHTEHAQVIPPLPVYGLCPLVALAPWPEVSLTGAGRSLFLGLTCPACVLVACLTRAGLPVLKWQLPYPCFWPVFCGLPCLVLPWPVFERLALPVPVNSPYHLLRPWGKVLVVPSWWGGIRGLPWYFDVFLLFVICCFFGFHRLEPFCFPSFVFYRGSSMGTGVPVRLTLPLPAG